MYLCSNVSANIYKHLVVDWVGSVPALHSGTGLNSKMIKDKSSDSNSYFITQIMIMLIVIWQLAV